MSPQWVFVTNLAATWYLVGLIWMVQVVHYNLFDRIGDQTFVQYESDHTRLITPIVGPPMLLEIGTAVLLLVASPAGFPRWAAIAGLVTVAAIWLSTFFIQVPLHNRLMSGFNEADYRMLVGTNWIRTVLWTARGLLLAYFAGQMMK
ncbi:MAG: hypothetical protein AAFX06_28845 [Planctomycetota bacterium]